MTLDIYWVGLLLLLPSVGILLGKDVLLRLFRHVTRRDSSNEGHEKLRGCAEKDDEARRFRRTFLQVYLVVMSAEWLQGPYLYTLLRDEKSLDERTVASLYVTGYVAAAASALVAGFMADRYGRRSAGLVFCVVHAVASISVVSDRIEILYAGRALAGIALTLLWTVFESWMVTEFNARGLGEGSVSLSSMFGIMTTSNCAAAIVGGVLGYCIVLVSGRRTSPFLVGVIPDVAAVALLLRTWNENFGEAEADDKLGDVTKDSKRGTLGDIKVWILSYVTCCFEGTNFLVLFYWPGLLKQAHRRDHPDEAAELPYGVIFAAFMAAMIVGAWSFNRIVRGRPLGSTDTPRGGVVAALRALLSPNVLLAVVMLIAGASLFVAVRVTHEICVYLAFLVFEVCNGVYLPSIAYQRGLIVKETNRAGLYGVIKLPLYIVVIVALCTTGEGGHHRPTVFISCFVVLVTAALGSVLGLRPRQQEGQPMGDKFEECINDKLRPAEDCEK